MKKKVLKVFVKDGYEQAFEQYCTEHNIPYKQYPLEILKTRYRAECEPEDLKEAEGIIEKITDMPILKHS